MRRRRSSSLREEEAALPTHRRSATSRPLTPLTAGLLLLSLLAGACSPGPEANPPGAEAPVGDEELERVMQHWFQKQKFFSKNRWFGVQTLQNPLDAWATQEIIAEVRPDVIVEAGTYRGGSALLWASILEELNPNGRVITIDVEDRTQKARENPLWARRVRFLLGSSVAPEIVAQVKALTAGKRVLVILDSLHTREHVRQELMAYADLVPVGSYVIVQDTGAGKPTGSWFVTASEGVTDFLATTDAFEIDRSRERFVFTNNPAGYLKRVR